MSFTNNKSFISASSNNNTNQSQDILKNINSEYNQARLIAKNMETLTTKVRRFINPDNNTLSTEQMTTLSSLKENTSVMHTSLSMDVRTVLANQDKIFTGIEANGRQIQYLIDLIINLVEVVEEENVGLGGKLKKWVERKMHRSHHEKPTSGMASEEIVEVKEEVMISETDAQQGSLLHPASIVGTVVGTTSHAIDTVTGTVINTSKEAIHVVTNKAHQAHDQVTAVNTEVVEIIATPN